MTNHPQLEELTIKEFTLLTDDDEAFINDLTKLIDKHHKGNDKVNFEYH